MKHPFSSLKLFPSVFPISLPVTGYDLGLVFSRGRSEVYLCVGRRALAREEEEKRILCFFAPCFHESARAKMARESLSFEDGSCAIASETLFYFFVRVFFAS